MRDDSSAISGIAAGERRTGARLAGRVGLRAVDRFLVVLAFFAARAGFLRLGDDFFTFFAARGLALDRLVRVFVFRFFAIDTTSRVWAYSNLDKLGRGVTTIRLMLVLLLASATGAFAQTAAAPDRAPGFGKGTVEVGGIVGATVPVTWLRAHADRRITMGSVAIGRVLTNQSGGGPLAGNFEMLLEVTPLIVVHQPIRAFGVTASPVHLRWNFAPMGSRGVRGFAEASGGIIYTSAEVPARTTRLNFIDQAGFGLRFASNQRRAWLAGYRFQHISNAGRVKPNPGANFNFLYLGLTFLR